MELLCLRGAFARLRASALSGINKIKTFATWLPIIGNLANGHSTRAYSIKASRSALYHA